jgi:RNA polymerase sigma-70 factor (ECF subfamily)
VVSCMTPVRGAAAVSPQATDSLDEARLIAALRRGDEAAFALLLDRHHTTMIRLALLYVSSRVVAEEVVQETWLEVLRGLDRFEGRSSLKTWVFRILTNVAKTRGQREARSVPFSSLLTPQDAPVEPAVAAERFRTPNPGKGGWASAPRSWEEVPEERFLAVETRQYLAAAIAALPPVQREVIIRRDVQGWGAEEVCSVLHISAANQRVLLHRARSRVRGALERYFDQIRAAPAPSG